MATPTLLPETDRQSASTSAKLLKDAFGSEVSRPTKFRDEVTITVKPERLTEVLQHCHDELGFNFLVDLCSVDHSGDRLRFEVVYHLHSYANGCDLRIKTRVSEDEPVVPTVSGIWPTADWHEREVYDMMGIRFEGHPDLRRILMWEGYPYYPLRKEFPLAGKESDMPDVAFSDVAPLAGGPFVSAPTDGGSREPRSRE